MPFLNHTRRGVCSSTETQRGTGIEVSFKKIYEGAASLKEQETNQPAHRSHVTPE